MGFKLVSLLSLLILTIELQNHSITRKKNSCLVLKDVTILDCKADHPLYNQTIIIRDSVISDIGAYADLSIPADAMILDLKGKCIMPGLIDHHAHVTIITTENGKRIFDETTSKKVLQHLLACGITTVRNPAAPTADGIRLRADIQAGKIKGPDLFTAGCAIQFANREADLWEICISNKSQAIEEVKRQIAAGVNFIKIYSTVPKEVTNAIIQNAHEKNIPVCGHFGATSWKEAIDCGVNVLEHGSDWSSSLLPENKRLQYTKLIARTGVMKARIKWLKWVDLNGPEVARLIKKMKETGTIVDPTLIAYKTKFFGNDTLFTKSSLLSGFPELADNWKRGTFVDDWANEDFKEAQHQWGKMLRFVKKMYDSEITLVLGSDLPNPWVIPGTSLYQEMKLFSDAGIPNYAILKICTVNGANALGIGGEKGTIEVGKTADLMITNLNPLDNIQNISSIFRVIKNGRIVK